MSYQDGEGFTAWKRELTRIVEQRLPCALDDLQDFDFAGWFDSGLAPIEAADNVFEAVAEEMREEMFV